MCGPTPFFLGSNLELGVSSRPYGVLPGGRGDHALKGFSTCFTAFDVAGFALSQGAGTSQLVSGFLIKRVNPCVAFVSLCLWMEKEFRASYVTILLMSREPQLVLLTYPWNHPGSQILFPSLRATGTKALCSVSPIPTLTVYCICSH